MKIKSDYRELDKIYKRRDRYEIPEFQRQGDLWSKSQKQFLIDTVLRGWALPKFYFLKTDDDPATYEVIDGQQRLTTLWDFLDNELELSEKTAEEFGGPLYKDLTDNLQDAIDDYRIDFDEITDPEEGELEEYFQRLQAGLPLSASEKLNAVKSSLRDFAKTCAKSEFISKKTRLSDRRFGHFDVMAKVLAIAVDGLTVGTRYENLLAVYQAQAKFSTGSNLAKTVKRSLKYLNKAFPDQCDELRQKAIVQSVVTLACTICRGPKPILIPKEFGAFIIQFLQELRHQVELGQKATDVDFVTFQKTVNANLRTGPQVRQRILVRKLLKNHPTCFSDFPAEAAADADIPGEIASLASEIRNLVYKLNEEYSATHGKDLFKTTNAVSKALTNLEMPISDDIAFASFNTHCYKAFWEGSGNRFGADRPQFIKDTNTLRTELQHDTDHGKPGKVAKKKTGSGKLFEQYSGKKHPSLLDSADFVVVQVAILADIRNGLATIEVGKLNAPTP